MDSANQYWELAEQDFYLWKNGNKNESGSLSSDILKSTFLHFRKKQAERIINFCRNAFEYHQEKENARFLFVFDEICEDFEIRYNKKLLTDDERREQTLIANATIIQGIKSGDQSVFNRLYEYNFPNTVKLVVNNSGNMDAAKDVFQQGIVILWEQVQSERLDLTCSVSTYLYSICRILWMEQLRLNKRKAVISDIFIDANEKITIPGIESTPDIYESISSAIESLGNPCKQLLESFYYQNLSWDEIAGSLGYANAASARNQKYKCLERIRKLVNVEVER